MVDSYLAKRGFIAADQKKTKDGCISISDKRIAVLFAITAFIAMRPYFTWTTFSIPSLQYLEYIMMCLCFIAVVFKRRIYVHDRDLFIPIFLTLSVCFYISFFSFLNDYSTISGNIIRLMRFMYFCLLIALPIKLKIFIFDVFVLIFTLSLIPGIIIFLLGLIGVELPYTRLEAHNSIKSLSGIFYKQYLGAVEIKSYLANRLCGMFEEPGVVGTFSALILIAGKRTKVWQSIVLVTAGIISQSLAFILLMSFYICVIFISAKAWKKLALIILAMLALYFVFIADIKVEFIQDIRNRLVFVDGELAGDNRADENYMAEYSLFIDGNLENLFFGLGFGAKNANNAMQASAGFRDIIYDLGLFGFALTMFWILRCTLLGKMYGKVSFQNIVFILAFVISMYQRPIIFTVDYAVLLICGYAYSHIIRKENHD